jgi:hypothetical protein
MVRYQQDLFQPKPALHSEAQAGGHIIYKYLLRADYVISLLGLKCSKATNIPVLMKLTF